MTTFCVECAHQRNVTRCHAPEWPKTLDYVLGKMTPAWENCRSKNTRGRCPHFKTKRLRRMWNALLSVIIIP